MHPQNCFLTLTYDQIHLPSDYSLHLEDWQLFAKRLRKRLPFRFFHCGEYGDETNRPHYHALIFGADFKRGSKSIQNSQTGSPQYTSPLIEETWGLGRHTLGTLTFESAAYVARYAMKKINGPQAEIHYQHLDEITGECFQVKPEYATMSRRNGIGYTWIEKYFSQTYPRDYVIINGKQVRPPSFYDTYCKTMHPNIWDLVLTARIAKGIIHADDQTPDRLAVREKVTEARTRTLARAL